MTLPSSGSSISFSQINVEIQRSSTSLLSLDDPDIRTMAGIPTSGSTISMSNLLGKSFGPTARVSGFSTYAGGTNTFTGNIPTSSGKLYILVTVGSNSTTYFTAVSGMTLGYRSGNISFFYRIATSSNLSVTATKTGTGTYIRPIIYEITGAIGTGTPTATNAVTASTASSTLSVTSPSDGTLLLNTLWLSTGKTEISVNTVPYDPGPTFATYSTTGTSGTFFFYIEKVPAGSYQMAYSWSGSTSSRQVFYAIR